jgi:acyl-coenzyme A synthetase/AMP-(fatty) acid ligase
MMELLSKLEPKLIISETRSVRKIRELLKTMNFPCEILTIDGTEIGFRNFNDYIESFFFDERDLEIPEDIDTKSTIALINCSSATTGPHKLIALTQHKLVNSEFSTNGFKVLSFAPLLWGVTLTVFYATLNPGSCHIISGQKPCAKLFKTIVENYKINSIMAPPNILNEFAKNFDFGNEDFDCIRRVLGMGQPVTESLERKLLGVFRNAVIINGYGTMETCVFLARNVPGERAINQKKILEGWSVKIVDSKGRKLGPGKHGMIFVKHNDGKEISVRFFLYF